MEDGVWRTIGGRRIFIKTGQNLSSAMKESGKFKKIGSVGVSDNKEKIQNDLSENAKDDKDKNYTYLEMERGEFEGKKYYSMSAVNKETKLTEGSLDYIQNPDGQYEIERINVMQQFRRNGVATNLCERLQEKAGDNEIKFGILTDDGKKLYEKIVETTRVEDGKYGIKTYYGKVKRKK